MSTRTPYQKALVTSSAVFVLSLGGLWYLWTRVEILSLPNFEFYFLGLALFAIALLGINIFQSLMIGNDHAGRVADVDAGSSPELFMELYKRSPVPYVLIDTSGNIISTNTASVRLFNTIEGGMDTQNLFNMLTSEDTTHLSLFPEKLRRGVFINDEEIQIIRSDETLRWVLFSLFSFTDSRGAHRGLVTLVDITKQKEIDKVKSEFVSLASHQLRTPISAMRWNVELLQTDHPETFSDSQGTLVAKIAENLRRMDMLVSDFLNVSKLELGTLMPNPTLVPLMPFLDSIVEEQAPRIQKKNITIEKRYDPTLESITSDTNLLHMVVGNLVSNAAKYTPDNGIIAITSSVSGDRVRIDISDTGMGIPESEQEKLFTKLFRASNARSLEVDGTGLGLYIVKQVAEVLGGTIEFVSTEGEGSTFTVTIPM